MSMSRFTGFVVLGVAALLSACSLYDSDRSNSARAKSEIPASTLAKMDEIGTDRNAPVLIRAFKKDSELEIWKLTRSGQYALLKTYPVCRWSGQLGPKTREGDRQVPEGFYTVTAGQMNPNSALWLSFNVGYPNSLERSLGYSGGDIMVHGTCSSRGCYAMTNEQIEEIYAVVREAFQGGQKQVQFQSYPFRMTAENMARFRNDPNIAFWKNLKQGSDRFDVTKREVLVGACGNRYAFGTSSQPACGSNENDDATASVNEKSREDDVKAAELAASGTPSVHMKYADGDQHPFYRSPSMSAMLKKLADAGEFSRPEALASVTEVQTDTKGNVTTANAYAPSFSLPGLSSTLSSSTKVETANAQSANGAVAPAKVKTATAEPSATQTQSENGSASFLQNLFSQTPPVIDDPDVTFPETPPLPPRRG
jgi:murein L,D-transpeptidase YafK